MLGIAAFLVIIGCIYWLYRHPVSAHERQPPWVRQFSIFHVTEALNLYGSFDPMPQEAVSLLERRLTGAAQQSLIVGLGNYFRAHCDRSMQRGDYELAAKYVRDLLSAEVRRANSSEGLRAYAMATHREETGKEIPEAELAAVLRQIMQEAKADEVIAAKVLSDVLRFNMDVMFKGAFGVAYWDYVKAENSRREQARLQLSTQA